MSVTLTKREIAWSRIGPVMGAKVPLIHYRVDGLPPEEKAYIANFGGFPCEDRWRVFHIKRGIKAHWDGDYKTADDALAALQSEILLNPA
jgi:hypothetical protein